MSAQEAVLSGAELILHQIEGETLGERETSFRCTDVRLHSMCQHIFEFSPFFSGFIDIEIDRIFQIHSSCSKTKK